MPVTDVHSDPEDLTVVVTADLAAPVERVWRAYTDPRQLERFWGPPGWPATFTEFDFTVGGRALYSMTGPHGETSSAAWEFTAIDEPHGFTVIDAFVGADGVPVDGGQSRMEFAFEASASGTKMTATSYFATHESLEMVLEMGMVEGLRSAMGQLDAVLQDLREYAQGKGTRVELLDDTHVRITRLVDGPRELVWRAYNEPDLMRQWLLGPDGWEMTDVELASAAGDSYHYRWAPIGDTGGEPFGFEGEAVVLDAPRRSVTTERMQGTDGPETINDLSLYEEDGATLVTTLVEYPDLATRDLILATGMVDGMEASYARLERELLTV
ncbi:ATPase [Microbacterium mangrovi]|uniref:ATPase n=1 Tax=Microbacterium mangrovi TaxID=1348253 RepID=A0A0B2A6C1_9MICO|nr:SRPBCC family protein [Microbacterium mangrovi]KHK97152.1 ATPase [Microbacterium mangrovi]